MHAIARPLMASPDAVLPSTPRSRVSLDHLPNELLEPIARYLIPQRLFTTRFALRNTGTWEHLDADVQWTAWKAQHDELRSFVLTSRRLAAIARPLLFYRIVIPSCKALVALYLLLSRQPVIGSWIADISCVAELMGRRAFAELTPELRVQLTSYWRNDTRHTYPIEVLNALLEKVGGLRNYLLSCPDQSLAEAEEAPLNPDYRPWIDGFIEELAWDVVEPDYTKFTRLRLIFPNFDVFQRLTSLRLYCHRQEDSRGETYTRVLADYIILHLGDLTSLRTLEFCCATGRNWFPEDAIVPPLPHLERLCLFGSDIHEPNLVRLVTACTNLVTLLVHFEEPCDDALDRPKLPGGRTLNQALLDVAPTLINLELLALEGNGGHYLTRGPERPRKRENHRLTCLPELKKLECLTIDYRGLFGTLGDLDHDDGERLLGLLPPALWCFTLICEWGTESDFKQRYMANLDMVLYGVQCLCTAPVPRIRTLSLAIHSWPAESKFRLRFRRQITEAAAKCARAGIKFRTHDLVPSYRDEDEECLVEEGPDSGSEAEADDSDGSDFGDTVLPSQDPDFELELEEEDEASEYYFSGDEESDPEREARRPASFDDFVQRLGDDHGHGFDELYYAWHEDRWDEYLF